MRTITKKEWNEYKKLGYAGVTIDGRKNILVNGGDKGTVLEFVKVGD